MTILNGEPLEPTSAANSQPAPVSAPADTRSLRMFGLISLLLAITVAPVGVVAASIALVRSRRAGYRNTLALGGLIYGLAVTVLSLIAIGLAALWGFAIFGPAFETCRELGRGIWEIDGVLYRCNV